MALRMVGVSEANLLRDHQSNGRRLDGNRDYGRPVAADVYKAAEGGQQKGPEFARRGETGKYLEAMAIARGRKLGQELPPTYQKELGLAYDVVRAAGYSKAEAGVMYGAVAGALLKKM